jgi:hypothetical protein
MLDNRFCAAYSSFMAKHRFHRVKLAFSSIPLILLLVGCGGHDAQFRKQIVGTWSAQESSDMFFQPDGSWYRTNASDLSVYYGTWDVKHGLLILSITNKAPDKLLTNYVLSFKIKVLNETNLLCENSKDGYGLVRYRNIHR